MKKIYSHFTLLLILFTIKGTFSTAQTVLNPGDIAIIGIKADNPDDFHFVLMVDIEIDTEIRFTDSGVHTDGSFRGGEGAVKYRASANIPAGVMISFYDNSLFFVDDNDDIVGNSGLSFSAEGDQIIAFQGASDTPAFIFAVQTNSTVWQADATQSTNSALPPGLTNGTTAVAVGAGPGSGDEYDNAAYNMSVTSDTRANLLAAICDNNNWIGDNTDYYTPEGEFGIGEDVTPPIWAPLYPALTNILDTRADLHVNMDETGIVYFLVLADGATPPTSAEVKDPGSYAGAIIYPDNFEVIESDTDVLFVIDGATPETAYDIYVVAEDKATTPNLQTIPVKFDATTTAARSLEITAPIPDEIVNVGQIYTFRWTSANIDSIYIGGYSPRHQEYFVFGDDNTGEPYIIDASLGEFDYEIPNDAATDYVDIIMMDVADTSFQDMVTPVYIADAIPPEIEETWPENLAINVIPGATPMVWFEEEVFEGTGKIYIRNEAGSLFEEYDIHINGPGEDLEFIDDNYCIRISPNSSFILGNIYYIEMDAGVVKDYFNNDFAGITGSSVWSFTIQQSSDATLSDLRVSDVTVAGFDPYIFTYTHPLTSGTTVVPPVTATPTEIHADVTITDATDLTGSEAERTTTITVVSDDESETLIYSIIFEVATAIDNTLASRLRIYPVPVSTELILENIIDVKSIEVLDITGCRKFIIRVTNDTEYRVNVTGLPRGIYFLKLDTGTELVTRKFIKK